MNRTISRLSRNETTGTSRIIRIVLDNLTIQYCSLNFGKIQIIFQPFLLCVDADFILTRAGKPADLTNIHLLSILRRHTYTTR